MKNLLIITFLFLTNNFTFAQDYSNKTIWSIGLMIEGNTQWQSKTVHDTSRFRNPNTLGVPTRFRDGYGNRYGLNVSRKAFTKKGNYQSWYLLIGGSNWEYAKIDADENFQLGLSDETKIPWGKATEYFAGIGYNYGICLNKKSQKLRFYTGFRGEIRYTQDQLSPYDKNFLSEYQNILSLRTHFVPEVNYLFKNRFLFSLSGLLPIARTSFLNGRIKEINSSINLYGGSDLDIFNWANESGLELSIGWIIK